MITKLVQLLTFFFHHQLVKVIPILFCKDIAGGLSIDVNRGLTEENTQLGIISPIGYFKHPIGDILSNWELVICSLTLRYQTNISPIPNWIYYPKLGI